MLFSDVVAALQTYNQSTSAIQIVVITEKTYYFFHSCFSLFVTFRPFLWYEGGNSSKLGNIIVVISHIRVLDMVILQDHPQVMLSAAPESWNAMYPLNIVRICYDGKR